MKADSETTGTVYQYDGNGNRTSVTYENGAKEVYTYYDDNLLATLTNYGTTGNVIESYQYTYDAAHNQKTKVDAKGTTSYTYDTLNRLIKVLEPIGLGGKLTEYGYDKAGNRLTERIINGSQTTLTMYAYDERNRLLTTTLQTPTGSKEISKYVYDNNGNTLQKTKETTKKADPLEKPSFSMFIIGQTDNEFSRSMVINEYDLFNQLVTTKTGAQIANYVYNGEGRRVQKNVNGQATNYLYEYDKVVLETDGKGKQTARNVYGINLLSRTIDNQKVNYLYNGHADVTALIDATGAKVASYYYDAFGNPLETTGTISNPIRYAGYQYDTETGLYYLDSRYYDSKIARFLTEDTFRGQDNDPLSLNLYTYCHNEPIMYSDPTGHRAETLGSKTKNDNAVFKLKKQVKADYVKTTKVVKTVVKPIVKTVVKTVVKPVLKAIVNTVVKPIVKTVIKPVVKAVLKPTSMIKLAPNPPKPGNISKNTEDSGRNAKNINDNQGTGNSGGNPKQADNSLYGVNENTAYIGKFNITEDKVGVVQYDANAYAATASANAKFVVGTEDNFNGTKEKGGGIIQNYGVDARAEAKVTVGTISINGEVGNNDIGVFGNAQGNLGSAQVYAAVSARTGTSTSVGFRAGAEASVFEGELSGGFNVLGHTVQIGVEGAVLDASAVAELGYVDGQLKGRARLGLGLGAGFWFLVK